MARRGVNRRNGEKRGGRQREEALMFYTEGHRAGYKAGFWRGVVTGAVFVAVIATGLALAYLQI